MTSGVLRYQRKKKIVSEKYDSSENIAAKNVAAKAASKQYQ